MREFVQEAKVFPAAGQIIMASARAYYPAFSFLEGLCLEPEMASGLAGLRVASVPTRTYNDLSAFDGFVSPFFRNYFFLFISGLLTTLFLKDLVDSKELE